MTCIKNDGKIVTHKKTEETQVQLRLFKDPSSTWLILQKLDSLIMYFNMTALKWHNQTGKSMCEGRRYEVRHFTLS